MGGSPEPTAGTVADTADATARELADDRAGTVPRRPHPWNRGDERRSPAGPSTPETGCISVVPGAHRDGTLDHRHTSIGEECWGDWDAAVDVPVRAGVVFNSLTPRAIRRNTTDEVRKACIVQYVPDGAAALEGDPSGEPERRRPLVDPVLHRPVVRAGRPVRERRLGS
jgi:hypothetical protein